MMMMMVYSLRSRLVHTTRDYAIDVLDRVQLAHRFHSAGGEPARTASLLTNAPSRRAFEIVLCSRWCMSRVP